MSSLSPKFSPPRPNPKPKAVPNPKIQLGLGLGALKILQLFPLEKGAIRALREQSDHLNQSHTVGAYKYLLFLSLAHPNPVLNQ